MKLEGVSTDSIQKTGPNPVEEKRLKELYAEGASLKDVQKAFPDILPEALEVYMDSLARMEAEAKAKAAPAKPAAKPDDKKPDDKKPADPLK